MDHKNRRFYIFVELLSKHAFIVRVRVCFYAVWDWRRRLYICYFEYVHNPQHKQMLVRFEVSSIQKYAWIYDSKHIVGLCFTFDIINPHHCGKSTSWLPCHNNLCCLGEQTFCFLNFLHDTHSDIASSKINFWTLIVNWSSFVSLMSTSIAIF